MRKAILALALGCSVTVSAYGDWESIKEKARALGSEVAETTKETWESTEDWRADMLENAESWSKEAMDKGASWIDAGEKKLNEMLEPETPKEARKALDSMSAVALAKLFKEQPDAKELFDSAYGYAVFDSRKFSLLLHTNGGSGVAVNRNTAQRTYMNMFGAGFSLGFGGKFYQQVMLFQDKKTFNQFVNNGWNKGWEGGADISAIAWKEDAELSARYNGGLAIFVLNDKGLLLDANVSGSKYWQDDELNKRVTI